MALLVPRFEPFSMAKASILSVQRSCRNSLFGLAGPPGWQVPDHFVALPSTALRALSNGIGFRCDRFGGLGEIRYSVLPGPQDGMSQITLWHCLVLPFKPFPMVYGSIRSVRRSVRNSLFGPDRSPGWHAPDHFVAFPSTSF